MMWGRKVLRGEVEIPLVKGVDITVHGLRNLEMLLREYRAYAALF